MGLVGGWPEEWAVSSSEHMEHAGPNPAPPGQCPPSLLPHGCCLLPAAVWRTWVCQTRQIKSCIDLPWLLFLQLNVKTWWLGYKVCLASLLLTVVSFLRERAPLVPGRWRWAAQALGLLKRGSRFLWWVVKHPGCAPVAQGSAGLGHPSGSSQGLEWSGSLGRSGSNAGHFLAQSRGRGIAAWTVGSRVMPPAVASVL